MKIVMKCLEAVFHTLDHDERVVTIYRHGDNNGCKAFLRVLDRVRGAMRRMLDDQILDGSFSLGSITSI